MVGTRTVILTVIVVAIAATLVIAAYGGLFVVVPSTSSADGSAVGTGPAAASWSQGRLTFFAEGTNGSLYHKWWNGATWSSWESIGGQLASGTGPAASQDLNLFAQGTDGQLWHTSCSGGGLWTPEAPSPERLPKRCPLPHRAPSSTSSITRGRCQQH